MGAEAHLEASSWSFPRKCLLHHWIGCVLATQRLGKQTWWAKIYDGNRAWENWGFQGVRYEHNIILRCNDIWCDASVPTFRRLILPPSPGLKGKPTNQPANNKHCMADLWLVQQKFVYPALYFAESSDSVTIHRSLYRHIFAFIWHRGTQIRSTRQSC
jgi:hypothetical protein